MAKPANLEMEKSAPVLDNRIFASKNGTKYYYPWCGGGKNIKTENKIYFTTAEKAELAGYTRASNCQPTP